MQFYKSRSITRCFVDGWKNVALNNKLHLRFLWLPATIAAIAMGFCLSTTLLFINSTYKIYALIDFVGNVTFEEMCELLQPHLTPLITMIVAWIAALFGYCLIKGAMITQIRMYRAADALPLMSAWTVRREILKDTSRIFLFIMLRFVVLCLVLVPTVWLSLNISAWFWLLFGVLFVAIMLPSSLLRMYYQQNAVTLRQLITKSWRTAMSGFGKWSILKLMTSIFAIVCFGVLLLPELYVTLQTIAVSESSMLDPDVVLPPYFGAVAFLNAFCATLLCIVIDLIVTWQAALFVGSQHTEDRTKETKFVEEAL